MAYFTISVDTAEENKKFAESLACDYAILSDPDKGVAKAYGVLSARGFANRWTFYIDKEGTLRAIDKTVKAGSAAKDTVARLEELGIAK